MNPFHGRHFQGEIILWAVRWYCKYGISYRELQEMLAERGVNVDHTTIYRWVQRYAPEIEKRLRWYWRNPTDLSSWHIDETYVKVNEPRQPGGCKLKTAPVRPVVAARPAEYVCSEDLF
ncbi:IS6 family transposase, partial [Escherichia coli]